MGVGVAKADVLVVVAARQLRDELACKYGPGIFSVGIERTNQFDWLVIYEHKRGAHSKHKLTDLDYEGFIVKRVYVGPVRPV